MPGKPKVFNAEKEQRLQEIRNRVPKVIVELIITFVPLNNFQTMKSIIEGYYPFHKEVFNIGNFRGLDFIFPKNIEIFLTSFQLIGHDIQLPVVTENALYHLSFDGYAFTVVGIEKIIALLQENLHSKRKMFYTWKLFPDFHSHIALWGRLVSRLIIEFCVRKNNKRFSVEETKTNHNVLFNLTITACGKEEKKEAINFFKGFGAFVDWMRTTVPIKYPHRRVDQLFPPWI